MARSSVLCSSSGSASVARGLNWAALQGPRRSGQPEICNAGHFFEASLQTALLLLVQEPSPLKTIWAIEFIELFKYDQLNENKEEEQRKCWTNKLTIHLKEENQHQMCVPTAQHSSWFGKVCISEQWERNVETSLEATLVWNSAQRLTHKGKV